MELVRYDRKFHDLMIRWINEFFGFHMELSGNCKELSLATCEKNLSDWTEKGHELFWIEQEGQKVGFIHLWYKGPNVAWIEDLFVAEGFRGRGYASEAIRQAEAIIQKKAGYKAVCMDVVPRNDAAMRLYHKLGYDTVSIITLRKNFDADPDSQKETLFSLDFKI